ncbi:MAG: UDP-N-acetylmuramoyl-tripeptide--D-alanyl-D-alanine ligase [Candidatus Paceibacterota bacterium]
MSSFFNHFTFFLYLFQLENYSRFRFLKLSFSRLFSSKNLRRQELVFTLKAVLLFSLSVLLLFFLPLLIFWFPFFKTASLFLKIFILFLSFVFLSYFFFLPLLISSWLLSPFDFLAKKFIVSRAKKKLSRLSKIKIIGITGSYGKTTMKEMIFSVLSEKFKVAKTPENINTPLGIARFILKELPPETEIFIVEMGAYKKGDIKELCLLAPPDVAVLTGINESHLERFGNLANTISAKFEIVRFSKNNASVFFNADDSKIVANFEKYLGNRKVFFFSSKPNHLSKFNPRGLKFLEDGSGLEFILSSSGQDLGPFKTGFLPSYIIGVVSASALIGQFFGLSEQEILRGVFEARPAPHRLNLSRRGNNILVIDDSYNGNPEGVKEAVSTLERFSSRRKIFATPGLVEMGKDMERVHFGIGRDLSRVADLVLLIKTSASGFIKKGLLESGFSAENIKEFNSMPELQNSLFGILKEGDVILFQNDWPDNYL